MRTSPRLTSILLLLILPALAARLSSNEYLEFVRSQAAQLRAQDQPPKSAGEWANWRSGLRGNIAQAWGPFPPQPAPLEARKLGALQREGYKIEKLVFQTLPGVWMTANAYVPDKPGKLPALLMVHGHWRGAKQDPVVQARCIGAAKLGFFVLVVDAFGAGERGVGKALGEYHGEMTAATLFPIGLPLSGLQVYENMRAVDYLQQRPEVDPDRIGISGASGGGNQSMYAGAWDERLKAVVPVCSVGNYQAYLGAACCMCEVVPGALRFTEEWAVLGMIAPRALLVINATKDVRQFSVAEAQNSLRLTQPIFDLLGQSEKLRHLTFESGHDYNKEMRQAVYGWMHLHLNQQGDGRAISEPDLQTEDPELLRCFPGDSRPDDWMTIPRFAFSQAHRLLATASQEIRTPDHLRKFQEHGKTSLEKLLGGFPQGEELNLKVTSSGATREFSFVSEKGIQLKVLQQEHTRSKLVILLDLDGAQKARAHPSYQEALANGYSVITLDLRATGELGWPGDKIGRAPDHTTAQWGLWIGRPLLGQWIWDLRRLLNALDQLDSNLPAEVRLIGIGPGGIVALGAAALDPRISHVTLENTLASFISEVPYEGQRMGIMLPGVLRDLGDVPDLAALVAPRPLEIKGGVLGNGKSLSREELTAAYVRVSKAYELLQGKDHLIIR